MSVLKELLEKRDAAQAELTGITARPEDATEDVVLTDEQEARASELITEIGVLDARIDEVTVQEKRERTLVEARRLAGTAVAASVEVRDEPMVYGEDSPHSFYADLVRWQGGPAWKFHDEAGQRLSEWGHQVEREVAHRSKIGKRAELELREANRDENPESARLALVNARERGRVSIEEKRAIASGGGASATASSGGAAFVTPVFFVDDYAPWREYGRAFADQCNKQPLPDYGMNVYIPSVTGPAGIAQQVTEGTGVQETDPSFGYLSGALITLAGEVTVSQQLLDRAGPNFSFDRMIFDQLNRDYAPKLDAYSLTTALANATSQSWSGNSGAFVLVPPSGSLPGAGGFYGQVSKSKAAMRTLQGTVLNPTHLFLQPSRWEYIAAYSDLNGRPLVVPDYAGAFNAAAAGSSDGDVGIEGNTGYRFNGLRAFTDPSIPAQGTTTLDQAIVADLNEVYLFEGTPVTRTLPQTLGNQLQTILQMYSYVTEIARYQKAVTVITGTGMSSISYID